MIAALALAAAIVPSLGTALAYSSSSKSGDLAQLERRKPALVFDTTLSVENAAACIAKNVTNGIPTVVQDEEVTRVLRYVSGGLVLVYRISKGSKGSRVEMFRALPGFGKRGLEQCRS